MSDYYFARDDFSVGIPDSFGTVLYALVVASMLGGLVGGGGEAGPPAQGRVRVAVFGFAFAFSILSGVAMMAVPSLAFGPSTLLFSATIGLSLVLAYLSVYVADFDLLGRLLST